MSIVAIMVSVFILVIIAYCRTDRSTPSTRIEVLPATKTVEIEIFDEMTKEKVRNLYEEQDVCNAKISHLIRQNKQYEYDMSELDSKIKKNLEDMRTQAMMQPSIDIRVLKASYDASNQNLNKHKLKLEGIILANQEKIVSLKKKSNAISEQLTKIGKEIYERQKQM